MLYEGDIHHFNITPPIDLETFMNTKSLTTTAPLKTNEPPAPTTTANMVPLTTLSNDTIPPTLDTSVTGLVTATAPKDLISSTIQSLSDITQSSTSVRSTTTGLVPDDVPPAYIDFKMIINIILSSTSLIVSLIAVVIMLSAMAVCTHKIGAKKHKSTKTIQSTITGTTTVYMNSTSTSPSIYGPESN